MPDPKKKQSNSSAYKDSLSLYLRDKKNYESKTGLKYDRLLSHVDKNQKVLYTEDSTPIYLNRKPKEPLVKKPIINFKNELNPKEIVPNDFNIESTTNIKQPYISPKYYDITDKVNQNFGGTESNYKYNPNNGDLPELAPEPYNSRTITPHYDLGGYVQQNGLNSKFNDYLNQNMKKYNSGGYLNKYADGGMMNTINEGGTHESNPNGGVPVGPNALAEQGETSVNLKQDGTPSQQHTGSKYIFSARQVWTPEEIKAAGLPPHRGPVLASEYMAKLNKKFADKQGSRPDKETLDAFTKRATALAEEKRAKEEQINAAIQANSQQVAPENTEVPPGMEEYAEQPQQQFEDGGGLFSQNYSMDNASGAGWNGYSAPTGQEMSAGVQSNGSNGAGEAVGEATKAKPGVGSYLGAATTALNLYDMGKGNTSTNKGKSVASGAIQGASAGSSFGWIGALVGGAIGAGAGYVGAGEAKKEASKEAGRAAFQANAGMPNAEGWDDTRMSAHGGYITSKPSKYENGGLNTSILPTSSKRYIDMNSKLITPNKVEKTIIKKNTNVAANGGYIKKYAEGGEDGEGTLLNSDLSAMLAKAYQEQLTNPANAQYGTETNPAYNVQRGVGLNPGPWGPKSKAALIKYQKAQGLAVDGAYGPDTFKSMGLTPGGRQYVSPMQSSINPITKSPIDQQNPIIAPYQSPENPFSSKYSVPPSPFTSTSTPTPLGETAVGKAGKGVAKWFGDNKNDIMRAYPILSNYIEREKIRKPTGTYSARLNDAYDVPEVDEARGMRDINTAYGNQYRAIGQMGGSQGQQRAAMLGVGANETDAISKLETGLDANRQANAMAKQQFKSQIAQYNAGKADYDKETYDKDIANYDTQRSKFTAQIGNDIGQVGLEQDRMDQVANMYGYTRKGKYLVDKNGNIAKPGDIAKMQAQLVAQAQAEAAEEAKNGTATSTSKFSSSQYSLPNYNGFLTKKTYG